MEINLLETGKMQNKMENSIAIMPIVTNIQDILKNSKIIIMEINIKETPKITLKIANAYIIIIMEINMTTNLKMTNRVEDDT